MASEQHNSNATASSVRLTAFQTALLAGGFVLFLAMLYQMQGFLNPPVLALAGGVLLWPLRKNRAVKALFVVILTMLILWAIDELAAILIPFAVVYLFAYLFDPLATLLHDRFGIPRAVTSIGITTLLIGVCAAAVFLIIPSIVAQFSVLFQRLVATAGDLQEWLQSASLFDYLERFGVNRERIVNNLTNYLQDRAAALAARTPNVLQAVLGSIEALLGTIALVAVLPVVHYYMLKDYPHVKHRLAELFPTFGGRRDYLFEAGEIVGNYLRGQLIVCAIAGFNVSVALILLDVPFALLIGILAGLLNLIPNIGIIVTNIVGIIIGLLFGDPWYWDVLTIVLVLMAQSLLEQTVLTPNIMSHQVGLHPILIIISLFMFGHFMGWIGLVIAVPATALLMTVYRTYRDRIRFELSDGGGSAE